MKTIIFIALALLAPCALAVCPAPSAAQVTTSELGSNSVTINCNVSHQVLLYNFRYREEGAAEWIVNFSPGSSFLLDDLSSQTRYEFAARVQCSFVETSDWSSTQVFETTEGCEPPLLRTIFARPTLHYIWIQCLAEASRFQLRWRIKGEEEWNVPPPWPSNTRDTYLLDPDQGVELEYAVRRWCGPYLSTWSESGFVTTVDPCPTPTLDQLSAAHVTDTRATLVCTAPASLYTWRYREVGTVSYTLILDGEDQVNIMDLEPDVTYEFGCVLTCLPEVGNTEFSLWSPSQTFRTGLRGPKITKIEMDANRFLSISWKSHPLENYRLHISVAGEPFRTLVPFIEGTADATETTHTDYVLPTVDQALFKISRN